MTKKERQIIIDQYEKVVRKEHDLWLEVDSMEGGEEDYKVKQILWSENFEVEMALEKLMKKLGFYYHDISKMYVDIVKDIENPSED